MDWTGKRNKLSTHQPWRWMAESERCKLNNYSDFDVVSREFFARVMGYVDRN